MFIQTLFMMVIVFVLGFGLLTTQLVFARHALQTIATTKARLALDDGLVAAKFKIADAVAVQGTRGPWPQTPQQLFTKKVCLNATDASMCTMSSTTSWQVTGSTTGASKKTADTAQNLQTVELDEQRVALRVRSEIASSSGQIISTLSRDITLRIFASPPYQAEVGSEDSQAVEGQTSQGDIGGNYDSISANKVNQPDALHPDAFNETRLKFSLVCHDAMQNGNQSDPVADNHSSVNARADGNDSLPWGTGPGAYETPCTPTYALQGPPDSNVHSKLSLGASYTLNQAGVTDDTSWSNGE